MGQQQKLSCGEAQGGSGAWRALQRRAEQGEGSTSLHPRVGQTLQVGCASKEV